MQALSTTTKKRYNKSPFYSPCDVELHKYCKLDLSALNDHLSFWERHAKKTGHKYPLFLKNDRLMVNKQGASARLAKSAYKNGHLDTQGWQYVNPFIKQVYKDWSGNHRSKLVPMRASNCIVIDWDYSQFASIEDLSDYIDKIGAFTPFMIVQTGYVSFHLIYHVELDKTPKTGLVNTEAMLIAASLLGMQLQKGSEIADEYYKNAIKEAGIDWHYLVTSPAHHKYRLPGTTKIKDYEHFLCKGQIYQKYQRFKQSELWSRFSESHTVEILEAYAATGQLIVKPEPKILHLVDFNAHDLQVEPRKVETIDQQIQKVESANTANINDYWKEYIPVFIEEIAKVLPKRYAKSYAEWLCQNLTFLKRKQLFISQLRLAAELNITQTTISKHLRLLVGAGILEVVDDYIKAKIPRKYGLGALMHAIVHKSIDEESLVQEYAPGETNEAILSDIRQLVHAGVEESDIVDFIQEKLAGKPASKRRSPKEIREAVRLWREKTNRKIPSFAVIDIHKYKTKAFKHANKQWPY